jgi:hypothetical protein
VLEADVARVLDERARWREKVGTAALEKNRAQIEAYVDRRIVNGRQRWRVRETLRSHGKHAAEELEKKWNVLRRRKKRTRGTEGGKKLGEKLQLCTVRDQVKQMEQRDAQGL